MSIQVYLCLFWSISICLTGLNSIWPSANFIEAIQSIIASTFMGTCSSISISREKQASSPKVSQMFHSTKIHVVKDMEWINPHGYDCIYTGEVDRDGKVCGEGVAIGDMCREMKYEITCLDGEIHGICTSPRSSYSLKISGL